ncbi:MAG: hypothetical protein ABH834_07260 [Candidatus Altiarchaeota archaeon]
MVRRRIVSKMAELAQRRVPLDECGELLSRFAEFKGDSRVSAEVNCERLNESPLAFMRKGAGKMLDSSRDKGYLTGMEQRTIESALRLYDSVRALNDGFTPRFRDGVVGLFTEFADVAGQIYGDPVYHYGIKRTINRGLGPLENMAERIQAGELFWDFHFQPAARLMTSLLDEHVELDDLPERIGKAKERASLATQ